MSDAKEDSTSAQIRGSTLLLGGQAVAVAVNLATQVLIVRYLSKDGYGAFAYALSLAVAMEAIAAFGMRRGVSRFLPIYEEQRRLREAAGTLILCLGTVMIVGVLCVLAVFTFRGAFSGSFSDDATAVSTVVLLSLLAPINAISIVLDAAFGAFTRPMVITLRKYVLMPVTRIIAVVILIGLGQGIVCLAGAYVLSAALGVLLYVPVLLSALRERGLLRYFRIGWYRVPARKILSFTTPLLSTDLSSMVVISAGGIMLGFLSTATEVANLGAVLPVAMAMRYVLSNFGLLLLPLASRRFAREDWGELNRLYWQTVLWTSMLTFPIVLTCIAVPEWITVLLFSDAYEDAAPVLAILAVGQFVNAAAGHNAVMLGVFGRVKFLALSSVLAIVINVSLLLAMIPALGAIGAAIASSATLVAIDGIRQIRLGATTPVHMLDRLASAPLLSMAGGGGIMAIMSAVSVAPAVKLPVAVALVVGVFMVVRGRLEVAEFFPGVARLPVVGRALSGRARTHEP